MAVAKIIWVDDEIESLQSQKMFLENKGYEVQTFTNGFDAIDYVKENLVDVVLIDESIYNVSEFDNGFYIKSLFNNDTNYYYIKLNLKKQYSITTLKKNDFF